MSSRSSLLSTCTRNWLQCLMSGYTAQGLLKVFKGQLFVPSMWRDCTQLIWQPSLINRYVINGSYLCHHMLFFLLSSMNIYSLVKS